jgi:hypothetical protein
MERETDQEYTKEVTFLADGRQLIYYNFTPKAGPIAPTAAPPQPEREER